MTPGAETDESNKIIPFRNMLKKTSVLVIMFVLFDDVLLIFTGRAARRVNAFILILQSSVEIIHWYMST
ncbi:MAG TPA: hypothetical protein VF609_14260 [Flavisolibacter sp.]